MLAAIWLPATMRCRRGLPAAHSSGRLIIAISSQPRDPRRADRVVLLENVRGYV